MISLVPDQSLGSPAFLSWEPLSTAGHRSMVSVLGGGGRSMGERKPGRAREKWEFMDMVDCKTESDGGILKIGLLE